MAFGGQSQQRWGDNSVNANEYIRDIQLTDLSGRVCHSGQARGKGMLVLAFFGDDEVSAALLPLLQRLVDAYKESGKLTLWGISSRDETHTRAIASIAGASFPILLDAGGYHAMTYGIATLPTVYLVASDGTVARKMVGLRAETMNDISAKIAAFAGVETPAIIAP